MFCRPCLFFLVCGEEEEVDVKNSTHEEDQKFYKSSCVSILFLGVPGNAEQVQTRSGYEVFQEGCIRKMKCLRECDVVLWSHGSAKECGEAKES